MTTLSTHPEPGTVLDTTGLHILLIQSTVGPINPPCGGHWERRVVRHTCCPCRAYILVQEKVRQSVNQPTHLKDCYFVPRETHPSLFL
jgi:hypothetical protein